MGKVGYVTWAFNEGPGSGVWGRHLDRRYSLGMWDTLGWGCGGR